MEVKIYEMDDEGHETETLKASGKIRVKYRGQPYYCKKYATGILSAKKENKRGNILRTSREIENRKSTN